MRQMGIPPFTEVVKNLIIINVLLFLAVPAVLGSFDIDLRSLLGLHLFSSDLFRPYQIVTHLFMHGSLMHLFMNMFVLWMFGSTLESIWGGKRFFIYYLITGLGAAMLYSMATYIEVNVELGPLNAFLSSPSPETLNVFLDTHRPISQGLDYDLWLAFQNFKENLQLYLQSPDNGALLSKLTTYAENYRTFYYGLSSVVGASGAVFGLVLAFGMLFPNQEVYLFAIIPLKAKYLIVLVSAIELFMIYENSPTDNIAHFAHLGGMLFGYFLLKYWKIKPLV